MLIYVGVIILSAAFILTVCHIHYAEQIEHNQSSNRQNTLMVKKNESFIDFT